VLVQVMHLTVNCLSKVNTLYGHGLAQITMTKKYSGHETCCGIVRVIKWSWES
jgi:hypothetical protein